MKVFGIKNLRVETRSGRPIVEEVSISLDAGEVLAVVGESGSGKTTAGLAMLGHARSGLRIAQAEYYIGGKEQITTSDLSEIKRRRGKTLSYVPQDPATALNPSMRIGEQIAVMIKTHSPGDGNERVAKMLEMVQLPSDPGFQARYPHQLSGGQQQRVAIAMGLVCNPLVAVFDEPTTGLDVVTQDLVLKQVETIRERTSLAMIYVTHDLSVVSQIADRVAVMYSGRIVEIGPAAAVLKGPRHPYTSGLLAATPDYARPTVLKGIRGSAADSSIALQGCRFAPRCDLKVDRCLSGQPTLVAADHTMVRCYEWPRTTKLEGVSVLRSKQIEAGRPQLELKNVVAGYRGGITVCRDVSFKIEEGECVALVGQSGSGKSTLVRVCAGLHAPKSGIIEFAGIALPALAAHRSREMRRGVQMIFQNPRESLNPRHTIAESIARSAKVLLGYSQSKARSRANELLELVRLNSAVGERYPDELSGGQLQRAAIARALAADPKVLICDEVTSALDVSVQAAVLELLAELQQRLKLSILFVTHDLGVVSSIAQRVLVFDRGQIVEQGDAIDVLHRPKNDYTRMLLAAAPSMSSVELRESAA